MKGIEFKQEFNILYNNIDSNAVPGLTLYEISVLLTKAQDEVIKNKLNPAGNKYRQGYDGSSKRQIDFSNITVIATLEPVSTAAKFDNRATLYKLPDDILSFLDEELILEKKDEDAKLDIRRVRQVVPISYDDYTRIMSKPFGEPYRNQAWRLLVTSADGTRVAEVIPNINDRHSVSDDKFTQSYIVRYLRKPRPIILEDLSQYGLTIDGMTGAEGGYDLTNPCELDPEIHREIIQRAVELAKAGYMSDQTNIQTQMGTRSE